MTSKEPEKKQELDAMMKRLGLLGIENKDRPGGQGPGEKGGKAAEPQLSPPLAPGRGQADELKDFLRHLETLEKEGAKQAAVLPAEADSVMARLERLDLASLQEEARAQAPAQPSPRAEPEPAPARPPAARKDDDFVALIRGIEEVKRDLSPEAGRQAARREIRAEKVSPAGEKKERTARPEAEPRPGEADYASVLDRLDKLDLTNVGGETKTDLGEITAWKKEIRQDLKGPAQAPGEASPQPPQAVQAGETEAILKRLEGLAPAEPRAQEPAAPARPAPKDAAV
ncbi:MAG: hypothetical protein LUQ67_03530, partial [Methanomicrobiales archaeon]|nr:hypothetical protein [Methanomicrobiales archaeon]